MRDVKVGRAHGFRGLGEVLVSAEMRRLVESRANTAALLYQALVAKQTGELARDVQVRTRIGGPNRDRWVGSVHVGEHVVQDLPHEFGYARNGTPVDGAHDLDQVLRMLARFT
ncbi:hypothetical protein [Gordonia alkanivorans]|uniref:Uncharacterized protein n=2 Tax=root TaxID=1 RepID=A0A159B6B6_9CAUD|nr:hypothetical protein [Gordonia alkanivorans]YP_009324405.1 neck protein [Gordonia phage GAL1]AKJ72028.1 hypothetical protein GAL1_13 [Gordonia phage GAL1]GAA13830.1 hypothetical protein GOALK_093_00180 [Gordonia alkanivorans NBRC 16433]